MLYFKDKYHGLITLIDTLCVRVACVVNTFQSFAKQLFDSGPSFVPEVALFQHLGGDLRYD